jgi:hypothetical protein
VVRTTKKEVLTMGLRICFWKLGKKWKDGSWLRVCYDTHAIKECKSSPKWTGREPDDLAYPVEGWKKPLALGGKFHIVV